MEPFRSRDQQVCKFNGLNGVVAWLSAKILALLRLSGNFFFHLRLTKKLKINFFVEKSFLSSKEK